MIDGVSIKKLKVIPDERGRLMEIFRSDEPEFEVFGQCYMTTAYPGVTKAWHYHQEQVDNFTCVSGMIKLALYDAREDSPTHGEVMEIFMGEHNPVRVRIPNYVYHGFKCISDEEAIIVNLPTRVYRYDDPDELRRPAHDGGIPYDWSRQDG
jgi:dTDP-4-dehydrorhamnose 3,5-epimerase